MNDFGRMVEAEIPRLRRYARALTRDVVQPTSRAAAPSPAASVATRHRPAAWLFTIMHNQHVNDVRECAKGTVSRTGAMLTAP
jgi:RNA polymerase sigma-70 factor (ECF subfamily)